MPLFSSPHTGIRIVKGLIPATKVENAKFEPLAHVFILVWTRGWESTLTATPVAFVSLQGTRQDRMELYPSQSQYQRDQRHHLLHCFKSGPLGRVGARGPIHTGRGTQCPCNLNFPLMLLAAVWTPPFTSTGPICLRRVARRVPRPVWIGPEHTHNQQS